MLKNLALVLRSPVVLLLTGLLVAAPFALADPVHAAQPPRVTLRTSAHTVTTTGRFTLTARTAHPVAGSNVILQVKTYAGWRSAASFPRHHGGRLPIARLHRGTYRLRAAAELQGVVLDVSPVVVIHVKARAKKTIEQPVQTSHSCTRTSTGSCIRGGEFCSQSMYGQTGYDANSRAWRCTGDRAHPHWE